MDGNWVLAVIGALVTVIGSIITYFSAKVKAAERIHVLKLKENSEKAERDQEHERWVIEKVAEITNGKTDELARRMQRVADMSESTCKSVDSLVKVVEKQWDVQRDLVEKLTASMNDTRKVILSAQNR